MRFGNKNLWTIGYIWSTFRSLSPDFLASWRGNHGWFSPAVDMEQVGWEWAWKTYGQPQHNSYSACSSYQSMSPLCPKYGPSVCGHNKPLLVGKQGMEHSKDLKWFEASETTLHAMDNPVFYIESKAKALFLIYICQHLFEHHPDLKANVLWRVFKPCPSSNGMPKKKGLRLRI